METLIERRIPISADTTYYFQDQSGNGFVVRGPGEIYICAREFGERRVNHYTYKSSNDPRIIALERRKA